MKKYITGMSVISCIGNTLDEFWKNLNLEEKILDKNITYKAEIPDIFKKSVTRRMDRFSSMVLSASKMALNDSNICLEEVDKHRIGTVYNTSYGSFNTNLKFGYKLESSGPDMVSPMVFAGTVSNACLGHTCMNLKLKGVSTMILGTNNIEYTCDLIESNKADVIVTAGADDYCDELYNSYNAANYVTKGDELCKPFDKDRSGIRLREAVGVLVIEGEKFINKDKKIYAEIIGTGTAYAKRIPMKSELNLCQEAFEYAMNIAIKEANIDKKDIKVIFAAASGSKGGDLSEANAIESVFRNNVKDIAITSIKGVVGENLGASLNINVIAALLSMENGSIPKTKGLDVLDENINLNIVLNNSKKGKFDYIMVNSADVTGVVSSIILKK